MMSLFPTQGRAAGQSGPEPLVSFKAGKMEVTERGNKFLVSPDLRKGKISLIQTDGSLIHFQWSDRTQNTVVDDLIVFPDTVTFSKVNTGREGDRVYLLQWRGQERRFFFWMQDKDASKDEENARKINEYINNPPQAQQPSSESWMDMMSQAAGRRGAAAAAPNNAQSGTGSVQLSQLANILAGLGLPPAPAASTSGAAAPAAAPTSTATTPAPASTPARAPAAAPASTPAAAAPAAAAPATGQLTQEDLQRAMMGVVSGLARRRALDLSDVLDTDEVLRSGVLDRQDVQSELLELLPESQRDPENLRATLRSAQFRQALHALSAALQSDSFNSVMANFGLDPQAGAEALVRGDSVRAFLEALLAAYEPENQGEQPMDQGGSS